MTSKDTALCLAIIKNSTITNINWEAVALDLGLGTANAANCQWRRFKNIHLRNDNSTSKKEKRGAGDMDTEGDDGQAKKRVVKRAVGRGVVGKGKEGDVKKKYKARKETESSGEEEKGEGEETSSLEQGEIRAEARNGERKRKEVIVVSDDEGGLKEERQMEAWTVPRTKRGEYVSEEEDGYEV